MTDDFAASIGSEEQPSLPAIPPAYTFTELTELEMQQIRARLIEHNADLEAAGVTLQEMRNVVWTCRKKANPMAEAEETTKPEKKTRVKATPVAGSKVTLSGPDANDFFG